MIKNSERNLKLRKKGFTLIELLAVIIILGILMIIAIPSVTSYISDSRKKAYITTSMRYIDGVRNKVNSGDIAVYETDVTYYVPGSCVTMEKGGDSPYGKFLDYYVVVTYNGNGYNYYWTSRDETNTGIYLTHEPLLDTDKVVSGVKEISTDIGVGEREKIKVLGSSCKVEDATEKVASVSISEKGYVDESIIGSLTVYKEGILNGAFPVLKDNLLAVTIADNGEVKKADTSTKWYSYEEKKWANAVILKDESVTYENGEVIPENNIESYFVWIPRYRYKLWNVDRTSTSGVDASVVHEIEIEFENKGTTPSNGSNNGEWLTHPAFTNFGVNGLWVGKFETGYDGATSTSGAEKNTTESNKVVIKPMVYSWRDIQVANAFTTSYNYQRDLDSHMMKNTEWGAVAYLSHSKYGQVASVRINNNSSFKTGYASTSEPTVDWPEYTGYGTSSSVTQPWNTATGYLASTTGNITGIYDMSGGASEYVMGVRIDSNGLPLSGRNNIDNSGFNGTLGCPNCSGGDGSITEITNGKDLPDRKYYDAYPAYSSDTSYSNRILGDATGEMGPFSSSYLSSWYSDNAYFVSSENTWFNRGGSIYDGSSSGVFYFIFSTGKVINGYSFRVVLAF